MYATRTRSNACLICYTEKPNDEQQTAEAFGSRASLER